MKKSKKTLGTFSILFFLMTLFIYSTPEKESEEYLESLAKKNLSSSSSAA